MAEPDEPTPAPPSPAPPAEPEPDPEEELEPVPTATAEVTPNCQREVWSGIDHFVCLHCFHGFWDDAALTQHMQHAHQEPVVFRPETRAMPPFPDQPPATDPPAERG